MITFKQFINESSTEMELLDICKRITTECGQFLSSVDNLPLMRGLSLVMGRTHPPQEISQPVNRPPKDSEDGFNLLFNAGIESVHGIKEIRRKTLYATGSALQARQYGNITFVFPKDGFKFMYSPIIQDSYEESDDLNVRLADILSEAGAPMNRYEISRIFTYLANEEVTPDDLLRWSGIDAELDAFYDNKIAGAYDPTAKLSAVFKDCLTKTFKELDYRTTDIHKAVASKNEISFYESDGYYLVPITSIRKHFSELPSDELDTPVQCYAKLLELL